MIIGGLLIVRGDGFLNKRRPGIEKACDFLVQLNNSQRFPRRLPSIRVLAAAARVSFVTMWKAVALLKEQGIIVQAGIKRKTNRAQRNSKVCNGPGLALDEQDQEPVLNNAFWCRIKAQIKKDILNGRYAYGATLPSCKELQHHYSASFPTMKKSLNALVVEGTINTLKNGYVVPALTTNPNSRIVALGCGWEDGKIWVDYQDKNYFRILESECIRLNIALDVVVYFRRNDRLCFIHSATRLPYNFKNDAILGIAYVVANLEIVPEEVLIELAFINKPVSILDVVGGWRIPALPFQYRFVRFFTVTASVQPAKQVAKYLLSLGHDHIAYISPFHKALWSQRRFEGIREIYRQAGYPNNVKQFVLNRYAYQWDFLQNPGKNAEDIQSLMNQYNEWKEKAHVKFFRKFGNLGYSISKYLTEWNCATGEIHHKMAPLFKKALQNTSLTAWLMANDYAATLALDYLKEKKIRVPEDISVIAFDNTLDAMEYQLTSYDFNNSGIINSMLRYILSPSTFSMNRPDDVIEVEGSIVERRSTLGIAGHIITRFLPARG